MTPRIEKKLCKRLAQLCPTLFSGAWVSDEPSGLACHKNSNISHCYHLGGGTDYFGEGCDDYSIWQWWRMYWCWYGKFPVYPQGHELKHYPNTEGFKPTTVNLFRLAISCEADLRIEVKERHLRRARLIKAGE